MPIVSLAAARAGVMQYSLPPWTRMHNKRGTILSMEGRGLDLGNFGVDLPISNFVK